MKRIPTQRNLNWDFSYFARSPFKSASPKHYIPKYKQMTVRWNQNGTKGTKSAPKAIKTKNIRKRSAPGRQHVFGVLGPEHLFPELC